MVPGYLIRDASSNGATSNRGAGMRILRQPGPALEPRRLWAEAEAAGEVRLVVSPGVDLLDGLRDALTARGIADAAVALAGGVFEAMEYMTGQPDPTGRRVATYGKPIRLDGPVTLGSGNAILGRDEDGAAILRCDAVVVDSIGRIHGGHPPHGACTVGPGGITAWIAAYRGAGFAVQFDPETNHPVFHPAAPGAANDR